MRAFYKWKTMLVKGALLSVGVLFFANTCFAQSSMVAADLVQTGKKFYEAGDFDKAVRDFSKALLVESDNKEALTYLNKMGLKGGIYGQQISPLEQITVLAQEISDYQARLEELNEQRQSLSNQMKQEKQRLEMLISKKEQEQQQLFDKHQELWAVSSMKIKEQTEKLTTITQKDSAKAEELVKLHTDLYSLKGRLNEGQGELSVKKQELEQIRDEFEQYQKESERELRKLQIINRNEITALKKERDSLEHDVFGIKSDQREKMKVFEGILRQKEADLYLEKNRALITSYELAREKKKSLNMKEQLEALRQERSELSLEAEALTGLIRAMEREKISWKVQKAKNAKKDQWVKYVKRQDSIIADLKSRLIILKNDVNALNRQKDAEQVVELNKQIDLLKKEIVQKEKDLDFSEEKQVILETRLHEYQDRLDIVDNMIKEREDRILFLEEQLDLDLFPDSVRVEENIE